jgi:hypothetical protein
MKFICQYHIRWNFRIQCGRLEIEEVSSECRPQRSCAAGFLSSNCLGGFKKTFILHQRKFQSAGKVNVEFLDVSQAFADSCPNTGILCFVKGPKNGISGRLLSPPHSRFCPNLVSGSRNTAQASFPLASLGLPSRPKVRAVRAPLPLLESACDLRYQDSLQPGTVWKK